LRDHQINRHCPKRCPFDRATHTPNLDRGDFDPTSATHLLHDILACAAEIITYVRRRRPGRQRRGLNKPPSEFEIARKPAYTPTTLAQPFA
jgi:hypothetical protein